MNARRYPRTLQQAFGPYTDSTLHPMREPRNRRRQDWALYVVAVVAAVVLGAVL